MYGCVELKPIPQVLVEHEWLNYSNNKNVVFKSIEIYAEQTNIRNTKQNFRLKKWYVPLREYF